MENKKFVYVDTEESKLRLDQIRQYYIMTDEAELYHCKTTTTGLYVCTQCHAAMSSNFQETSNFFNRGEIILKLVRRLSRVKSAIWIQRMNNEWLYFSPHSACVTKRNLVLLYRKK